MLLEVADLCHQSNHEFRLLIAGDGPLGAYVADEAAKRGHVHYFGRVDGDERARLLRVSDVALMPGLVGLGILDAFAAGIPLVTTGINYHSPEIEYLHDGINGRSLPDGPPHEIAGSLVGLMADHAQMDRLKRGAIASGNRITTKAMVDNFAGGRPECARRFTKAGLAELRG